MRLMHILPYAALIVLGEAAIGSVPGIVAAREGGMGLGSALIMAQAAQVAGIAFGAMLAAHLIDRWSLHVALVGGALLYYGGLIGVGHQPAHLLGWVVVVVGLGGAGLGMVLTASFSAAAGVIGKERPLALAVLLIAALAAGLLVGNAVFLPGPPTLVIVAAIILGGSILLARYARGGSIREPSTPGRSREATGRTMRLALALGALLAVGVLATLWGIEPSRVSAAMVAGSLGAAGAASLDGLRLGLVLLGLAAVAAGAILLWVRGRPSSATVMAAAASASTALAAAGLLAVVGFAMPRELSPPDSRGGPLGELAALAGGAGGLVLGAWLLGRGARPRTVASVGSLILAGLSVLLLADAGTLLRSSGALGPIAAIAVTAFGAGFTAVALRLLLADAPAGERGLAAAAGVAAAAFGGMAGLMIGAGEGMALAIGAAEGMSTGLTVLLAAALVGVGLAAVLPVRHDRVAAA
jgi:hypothetical protein